MAVGTTIALIKALSGSGGGGGSVDDVQVNGTSVVNNGVANIPAASSNALGVVKIDSANGIGIESQNKLYVEYATSALIKAGTGSYRPITPPKQHEAAFYGLAKAAGDSTQSASSNAVGTYTGAAIDKIIKMLGIDTLIAPHETSGTASKAYAQGDCFIYQGKLYKASTAISSGAAIVPGTNCTQTTLLEEINA